MKLEDLKIDEDCQKVLNIEMAVVLIERLYKKRLIKKTTFNAIQKDAEKMIAEICDK